MRDAATCSHCGLPLGRRPVIGSVGPSDGAEARFCCYGCVLAQQVTRARGDDGAAAALFVRLGLGVFFAVNVMMVSMPAYVPYVYGGGTGAFGGPSVPLDGPLFQLMRVLAMLLAAPVLLLLGGPIVASAWRGLRDGGANTDALIVLGTFAAYGLSIANTLAHRPDVYFDTATMLLVLVTVGRYLEASAKAEAGRAVRARLVPSIADAVREGAGGVETVAPDALVPGDVVRVAPGGAFPTDGVVESGEGGVDEATLTGESWPVAKRAGSAVAGGTCSIDGVFRVRVMRPARESAAARIANLLAAALQERTPWERIADRAARVLVPLVIALACVAGIAWTWAAGIDRGLMVAIAVLVVACPCGLGIATPVAVWTGLANASRRGVIVRSAPALERAAALGAAVFDKTGTLTTRTPRLVGVEPRPDGPDARTLLRWAAAVASNVPHPLSRAIVAAAPAGRTSATDVRSIPGRGARGRVDGRRIVIGSARLVAEELGVAPTRPSDGARGAEVFVVADDALAGVLRFAEAPRPEARAALASLRELGLCTVLATGDAHADAVVPEVIAETDARLGLLPADKVAAVRALRAEHGLVAMVGDGVNDAPALAGADLGIAIGSATDLARTTADVAIVGDDLGRVPWLVAHARRVGRIARQNLAWAFGYNAIAVALAVAGELGPLVAAAAMLMSSLAVVANARRLA